MRILILVGITLLMFSTTTAAQQLTWERTERQTTGRFYFDQEHHEEYVRDALTELTGKTTRSDASRVEQAQITMELLNGLRTYGERQVGMIAPEIPEWFSEGYLAFNPATVSHSRYLDAAATGELAMQADIATLYAFWCAYDAEWFNLSRNAAYKAWLSAVLLDYAPQWRALRGESAAQLHERLVAPLQTPDEPYREIDNWINAFVDQEPALIKPKVRDALVQELIGRAGLESDDRFFDDTAYGGPLPADLGLSDREFYLLAALSLEFSSELYDMDPQTKQLLHFRDYFTSVFRYQ